MVDCKADTLIAVAEEKSFTAAARRLSLTQPAVSHIIRTMEQEFGVDLFIRRRGEILPTQQGEIAITYARRFKAMEEKMVREIAEAESHISSIRIGITHTSESNMITRMLGKFSSNHDGIRITIITDTIKNLYNMLANYELDLAIVDGKPTDPQLYSLMLDTDYLVCVLSPRHHLAGQSVVTLGELKKEQMILRLPASDTRMLFESTLESSNDSIENFNVILEVDNVATIKDLIRQGMGVSILPESVCKDEVRKGKLAVMPIENLSMIRQTNIIYNKYFTQVDLLKELVAIYKNEQSSQK